MMRYIAHLCHGQILVRSLVLFITGRNEVAAQVIFLHLIVILFTGGVVSVPPPGPGTPRTTRYTPKIRSTSGRYASYWNAFL